MTATFLVTLDVDDPTEAGLLQDAELIYEMLTDNGLPVTEVQPWSRHNAMPSTHADMSTLASVFPKQPTQTIQPIPTV